MKSTEYCGKDSDSSFDESQLLTMHELKNITPASDAEILEAIKKYHVVEINYKLRMLSRDILYQQMRLFLDTVIHNGWDINNVSELKCIQEVEDQIDEIFLTHILEILGTRIDNDIWKLNEDSVAKSTANILLRFEPKEKVLYNHLLLYY